MYKFFISDGTTMAGSKMPGSRQILRNSVVTILCLFLGVSISAAQLNQDCIISVLNRNVQVNSDGTWVLPNIPANFGPVRAPLCANIAETLLYL